jgi:hypothetical protein
VAQFVCLPCGPFFSRLRFLVVVAPRKKNKDALDGTAEQFIATYKAAPSSIHQMESFNLAPAESGFSYYSEDWRIKLYCRPSDVTLTGAATKTSVSIAYGFRHVV